MSVKVEDLLRLPCLREAKVLAGKKGLQRTVSSITVLEYSFANEIQEEIFNHIVFYGSEIVISAFANAKDSVEVQCANIRQLAEVGEVGLILYYVGIILPKVDKRLIQLADSLDFVLICMPEKRFDLRYSEVISEVMETIVKDQLTDTQFQNEILERVSRLPTYQRSIDTVMRMLSDRLHSSIVLTDESARLLNAIAWPRTSAMNLEAILAKSEEKEKAFVEIGDGKLWLHKSAIQNSKGVQLKLFFLKENEKLKADEVKQATEVIQLAINLWSQEHGQEMLPELVRTILQDEPVRMRRIASAFQIDVASIHNMWVIIPQKSGRSWIEKEQAAKAVLGEVRAGLSHICKTVIADIYDACVVVFMDEPQIAGGLLVAALELQEKLTAKGVFFSLGESNNLRSTKDVREAYLLARAAMKTARAIFPQKTIFTHQELQFAENCRKILEQGEELIEEKMAILNCIRQEDRLKRQDLCDTLAVYMLDAGLNIPETAGLMYLHKNTIKYRIARISECLGYNVNRMPEAMALYEGLALRRVLASQKRKG